MSRSNLMWLAPIPIAVALFFASLPWLDALGDPVAPLATAAISLFVMIWTIVASRRWERGMDEVQQAGQHFAARYGMTAGSFAFALLLLVPPFRDFATGFVIRYGEPGPGLTVDRSIVVFAMMLGFLGVSLLQFAGIVVMATIWWRAKR